MMDRIESEGGGARNLAMFCHLLGLSKYVIGLPFAGILGPLILWLIKRDQSDFVDDQGRESLNFQISIAIYGVIAFILAFVMIGFAVMLAIFIFDLICVIMASIAASKGEYYRYPLCLRFVT